MFIDARSVPVGTIIETDVCIIGGGAAGITMARDFIDSGVRAVLLESGDITPDPASQDLYSGSNVGRPYERFPHSRFRQLGGTTNGWGGAWCDLPSPLDFEEREGVPYSGWPFSLSDLKPWYERAQPVLMLGHYAYELSDWGIAPEDVPQLFLGPHFMCRVLQQAPTIRFGRHYGPELKQAQNVSVYLNANALYLQPDAQGRNVQHVEVGTLSGSRFQVRARMFIISCGGIENARLLLLSENETGVGLGNANDLVGRFFMLHLEYKERKIRLSDPYADMAFQTGENGAIYKQRGETRRFVSYISLSDDTRRRLKLPAVRFRFVYPRSPELDVFWRLYHRKGAKRDLLRDLGRVVRKSPEIASYVVRRVIHGRNKPPMPLTEVPLKFTAEQMPNPDSRIGLGGARDVFGLRKVQVDWRLTAEDSRGIVMCDELLASELGTTGYGKLERECLENGNFPESLIGDQHHMGTTKMHCDPKRGVVNENCRVHGVDNLYMAGCSVFPTGGTFNPTLTILALALRVSDHVKARLR